MVQYFTTTWADDTAVMGWTVPDATSVVPTVQVTTTEVLYEELLKLGMRPNTKPGKTEAIVDIRGKASVPCRQHLHHGLKGRIPLCFSEARVGGPTDGFLLQSPWWYSGARQPTSYRNQTQDCYDSYIHHHSQDQNFCQPTG